MGGVNPDHRSPYGNLAGVADDEVLSIDGEVFTARALVDKVLDIHWPSDSELEELTNYLRLVVSSCGVDTAERLEPVDDTPAGAGRMYSASSGVYIHASDLGSVTVSILLGVLTHGAWWVLSGASFAKLLRFDADWRPHFVTLYLRADGDERLVLDFVHAKQTEWVVTNFEAYETHNFRDAFGKVAPTLEEISLALRDLLSPQQVLATVEALHERRVLTLDNHRYSIPF